MDSATQRAGMLTLDELCNEADLNVPSFAAPEFRQASLLELIRRAKGMDAQLTAEEDKPEHVPMPKPVESWLCRSHATQRWHAYSGKEPEHWDARSGPHMIVPGMMDLSKLAEHGIWIAPDFSYMPAKWFMYVRGPSDDDHSTPYPNADEAQWAATQRVKEAGHGS